jgi:hypothetical protein
MRTLLITYAGTSARLITNKPGVSTKQGKERETGKKNEKNEEGG